MEMYKDHNNELINIIVILCMYNVSYSRLCSWRLCSQSGGLPPAVAVGHECDRLWGQIFTEEPV